MGDLPFVHCVVLRSCCHFEISLINTMNTEGLHELDPEINAEEIIASIKAL